MVSSVKFSEMKKLIFSKVNQVLSSDKFMAILILLGGFSIVFLTGHFKDSFASETNDSNSTKEIVDGQEIADIPSSKEETDICYECGTGDVLGTSRDNCNGTKADISDSLCPSGSFTLTEELEGITEEVIISRNCELSIYEITYPYYWNGHNRFVNGSTDNRYTLNTGEWPDLGRFTSVSPVNAKEGIPTVAGNSYGSIYEPANEDLFGKNDGSLGGEITISISDDEIVEADKSKVQGWVTPACPDSAPGSYLIGDAGCASPIFAQDDGRGIVGGNEPIPSNYSDTISEFYPDDTPSCSSYGSPKIVPGTTERSCIDTFGFDVWNAKYDIFIKLFNFIEKTGLWSGKGSTGTTILLNMEEFSMVASRMINDVRMNPGDNTERRYVATPCKVQVSKCLTDRKVDAACIWPDYLYYAWANSEMGSPACDPDVNFASVIAVEGEPPVRFNFCNYDGGYGFWNYVEYVVKRCNAVINEGKKPISTDELNSCKMVIKGSL